MTSRNLDLRPHPRGVNHHFLRSPLTGGQRDERGGATLETVVVIPAILFAIWATFQGALFFHARDVAQAAAQEGTRAASNHGATEASGRRAAQDFLAGAGEGTLAEATVSVKRTAVDVSVVVSGRAPELVPGLPLHVEQRVTGPVERFTTDG